jgi:hypothetical protein
MQHLTGGLQACGINCRFHFGLHICMSFVFAVVNNLRTPIKLREGTCVLPHVMLATRFHSNQTQNVEISFFNTS